MKIEHHITVFFLVPVIGITTTILLQPVVEAKFPTFMVYYPIVAILIVVLLSLITHFLNISCPKCDSKLDFNNDIRFEEPRYQCKNCGFERKGFLKNK